MWEPFIFFLLLARLQVLEAEIEELKEKSPEKLYGHPSVRLYSCVIDVMRQIIANPADGQYLQGNTLGPTNRDWRRAKAGLPQRYRLFFKFFSDSHSLFFVWLNDKTTLRKEHAKTDCYAVFRRMLERGEVPSSQEALRGGSEPL